MFVVRRKERLGWESVGLQHPSTANTVLWVLITMVGAALSIAIAFAFIRLLNLPIGSSDSAKYELLPTWVLAMTIVRSRRNNGTTGVMVLSPLITTFR